MKKAGSIITMFGALNARRTFCVQSTVPVINKCALRGPTTCSDPVGIFGWGGALFVIVTIFRCAQQRQHVSDTDANIIIIYLWSNIQYSSVVLLE